MQGSGGRSPVAVGCGVVIAILLIVVGCSAIVSSNSGTTTTGQGGGGGGGTTSTQSTTTTRTPERGGTTSGANAAPQVPEYEWTGVRITRGTDFRTSPPRVRDRAFGTVAFVDYQDRFTDGGGAGSRASAPWTSSAVPTYQECVNALATNPYSSDERNDLPKRTGTGICLQHGDEAIVFVRVVGHEPNQAVRVDATVWRYVG